MALWVRKGGAGFYRSLRVIPLFWACSLIGGQSKEILRKLEEENETIKAQSKQCSTQLESVLSKQSTSQKTIQELTNEVSRQKLQGGKKL